MAEAGAPAWPEPTPNEAVAVNAGGKLTLRGAIRVVQASNAIRDAPKKKPSKSSKVASHTPVLIRAVFLLPFLWGAVRPLRFIEIHPTPFAEARSAADYRDTSYFTSLCFAIWTIFATVLTHIFEAGLRHQLTHESAKVSPKVSGRYAANPSNRQSVQHATSCL